ncbi:M56 family metallopeptidase [Colwelliaceae bacterium 6441]
MESVISSPLLYNLALTLIHFLWQGCLIALTLKFFLLLTPHNNSRTRYAFSTFAMLACLVMPIITFITIFEPNYIDLVEQSTAIFSSMAQEKLTSNATVTWYQSVFDSLPYVSLFWLSIVLLLTSKLVIELYNVNQLPKKGTLAANKALQQRFEQLILQINLTKKPQLLISLTADIPMAIGWLKPVILIPAAMLTGLTPAQLDMLLLHELAHIRRHDYLVNCLQTLIETFLFFHPAVLWISKQMRNEREYCSDDIAVKVSGNPIAYAHTLADTATLCSKHRHHAIPNMAMAASGGDLKQRVVRLIDQHHCSSNDDSGKFLAAVLIIFSVSAVAIKPYLNTSIIDFSSGHISLFKTANEITQARPENAVDLSATSMAQLLLKQEKKTQTIQSVATDIITRNESLPAIEEKHTPNSNKAVITELAKSPLAKTKSITNENVTETLVTSQNNSSESIVNPVETQSPTEALLSTPEEKSISEQAFERTDSSKKQSNFNNPYANRVASLIDEPMLTNEIQESPKTTLTIESDINLKPLYTVSPPQKDKVTIKAPQKYAAQILTSPDPKYPVIAKRRGIEMDVTVNFVIDADGLVRDITFEQKNKVNYFRSAIRAAMTKWRFLPAKINGQPIESNMSKIFSFSLRN